MAAFLNELSSEEQDLNERLQSITGLGPTDAAVAELGEFIDAYWDRTDGRMPIFVSTAAMYQAWGLQELGRIDESIDVFGRIVDRFGDSDDSDLTMMTIAATVEKGSMLGGADGVAAAVDLLVERYGARDDSRVRDQLATARMQQAVAYRQEGRADEMTAVVEAMRDEFGADTSDVAQAALAGAEQLLLADPSAPSDRPEHLALLETARIHIGAGNTDPGVEILDQIIARWGESADPAQLAAAIHARLMKAAVESREQPDLAAEMLEDIIDRFGAHPAVEVRRQVAAARINRGVELTKAVADGSAELGAAREWFEQTVHWIDTDEGGSDHELDIQLAVAMFYSGMSALEMNDADGALGWFGRIVDRWGDTTEPAVRNIVARSMLNSAAVFVELDQPEMTLAALDVLLERFDPEHGSGTGPGGDSADGTDGELVSFVAPGDPDLADVIESARAFRAELTGEPGPNAEPG